MADSSFAALKLLEALRQLPQAVHGVTRLRLDAALYTPAPPRQARQIGGPCKVGQRLPTLPIILLEEAQTTWQLLSTGVLTVLSTMLRNALSEGVSQHIWLLRLLFLKR